MPSPFSFPSTAVPFPCAFPYTPASFGTGYSLGRFSCRRCPLPLTAVNMRPRHNNVSAFILLSSSRHSHRTLAVLSSNPRPPPLMFLAIPYLRTPTLFLSAAFPHSPHCLLSPALPFLPSPLMTCPPSQPSLALSPGPFTAATHATPLQFSMCSQLSMRRPGVAGQLHVPRAYALHLEFG